MDIGRQAVGLVERADAHEADRLPGSRVVAPKRDAAFRAARDPLPLAARCRNIGRLGFALHKHDAVGLDQGVEREG